MPRVNYENLPIRAMFTVTGHNDVTNSDPPCQIRSEPSRADSECCERRACKIFTIVSRIGLRDFIFRFRFGLYTARSHIRDTGEKHSTVQNKLKIDNNKSAIVALFLRKSSLCHVYANSLNF